MPDSTKPDPYFSRLEAPELIKTAAKVAGFDLGKRPSFATAANVSDVRNRTYTFSQRRDSRTIFASDVRYGSLRKSGVWTGSDRQAIAACRHALRAAGVPAREIAGIEVVSEWGSSGERRDGGILAEDPQLLRKLARARRSLDGVPVWSSYTTVGLTGDGQLGSLELHWPSVAPEQVREAQILQKVVDGHFKSPAVPGARLAAMEPGILHSPAVGFFMDVIAALRLVYVAEDPAMGRLATLYVDRHGEPVALPRSIHLATPDDARRNNPKKG